MLDDPPQILRDLDSHDDRLRRALLDPIEGDARMQLIVTGKPNSVATCAGDPPLKRPVVGDAIVVLRVVIEPGLLERALPTVVLVEHGLIS